MGVGASYVQHWPRRLERVRHGEGSGACGSGRWASWGGDGGPGAARPEGEDWGGVRNAADGVGAGGRRREGCCSRQKTVARQARMWVVEVRQDQLFRGRRASGVSRGRATASGSARGQIWAESQFETERCAATGQAAAHRAVVRAGERARWTDRCRGWGTEGEGGG